MIGFPFDSKVEFDAEGNPTYDRAITSLPYRKLLKELFKTGIMPNISTNMQVIAYEGMRVKVLPGFAMVNGLMKLEEAEQTLTLEDASTEYSRIDTIVLRLNDNEEVRACEYAVVKGVESANPTPPTLTRTSSIYELGLADILIKKNSTVITGSVITDTRYDSERCGVISSISEFDVTTIYNQLQADIKEFKEQYQDEFSAWTAEEKATFERWEELNIEAFELWQQTNKTAFENWRDDNKAAFDEWFKNLQAKLDGDVAGKLQNEIDELGSRLEGVDDDITGIKEDISGIQEDVTEVTEKLPVSKPTAADAGKAPVVQSDGSVAWGEVAGASEVVSLDSDKWNASHTYRDFEGNTHTGYAENEYCIENNILHKALKNTTQSPTNDPTSWKQVSVVEEIGLQNVVEELAFTINTTNFTPWNTMKMIKKGNIVTFTIGGTLKVAKTTTGTGTQMNIASIVDPRYFPKTNVAFVVRGVSSSSANYLTGMQINTDGSVVIASNATAQVGTISHTAMWAL